MDFSAVGDFIANIGFPIFIAATLLIYIDRKLDKLTEVIGELKLVIKTCFAYGPGVETRKKRRRIR